MTTKYEEAEQEMLRHKFEPTGQWEVRHLFCINCESLRPVLVAPDGSVDSVWSPDVNGQCEAASYAATYNMNDDKSDEFRVCPYCANTGHSGCSWCCG